MACTQTLAGIARDCASNRGGIKRVLLANFDDVTAKTVSNDIITAITMATSTKFKEYNFRPQTAALTSTPQINNENGVSYVQSVLSMAFAKMDTTKRLEINAMMLGDLAAIVEDNNGKYWYLGYDDPIKATGGESGTGTAYGDANRYGIEFQDNSNLYPYEVNASIISGLL